MLRRLRLSCGQLLLLLGLTPLAAHEEWNNFHLIYSANFQYTYPFDGRTPKIAVAALNHHDAPAPAITFTFTINGTRPSAAAFPTFPDGGFVIAAPNDYGLASALTAGIYDGRAGPAPAVGETKDFVFQFVAALAPGESPPPGTVNSRNPDPDNNNDIPGTTTATVKFTNLGDTPALSGPFPCSGIIRFPTISGSPPPSNLRVEVATPFSNWLPLTLTGFPTGAGPASSFSQGLPSRNDWHIRISSDGYQTIVVALGFLNEPHPPFELTLTPAAVPDLDYRRVAAIATPTGFWRGVVSESAGTFVAFPGQENWKSAVTETESRALRSAARLYKYRFDGTKIWEHAPGWETWAGDMTPDGRYVAYALNPTILSFSPPTESKLVLLDGATGVPIWTRAAPPSDAAVGRKIDALELAFSPDARWLAVGSAGGGTVTLVERATGNFVWTIPGAGTRSFCQIRKLRFSPDSQFLYCGSGDSQLRKLRVGDGAVLWRVSIGGWPSVNGLDLTPDGAWLTVGTKSLDATVIRASDGFTQWQKETQFLDAVSAPDGRHLATTGGQVYRLIDGSLAGMTKATGLTRFTPDGRHVLQMDRDVRLLDLGGKLLKTFDPSGIGPALGERPQWAHLSADGRYAILLGRDMASPSQTGIAIYERRIASATVSAPLITGSPLPLVVATGTSATLLASASGPGPLSYQWRKNGSALPGALSAALVLASAQAPDAGDYSCLVTNAAGTAMTAVAKLDVVAPDVTNPARLTNLAVLADVSPAVPLSVGFAIGGSPVASTKTLLIRGAGPSLSTQGIATGTLPAVRVTLFDGATPVLTNDDWSKSPDVPALTTRLQAFPFLVGSKDAALAATAVSGSYSMQLGSATAAGAGTVLAEIYDGTSAFAAVTPRLVNVSARTDVDATHRLVAGFVITGGAARTVLIRGIGPGLAEFGIRTVLFDPQLELFAGATPLATNDNWHEAPNAVAIASAALQVNAFPLPPTSRDAALLLTLPPGNYSAQVSGATGSAGNALVEVYEVP